MKIVDMSDFTHRSLESSSLVSIASIAAYYRNNIGKLNNLLNKDYSINSTSLELLDSGGTEIGAEEFAIYEKIYIIGFYDRMIRNSLGAGSVDQVTEVSSDGGTVRFLNRNLVSQNYIQVRKELREELKQMLNHYKVAKYSPLSVTGDDLVTTQNSIFELTDDRNG